MSALQSGNYITQMSVAEKITFLKILSVLSQSDNNFDQAEKDFITELAVAMDVDDSLIDEIFSTTDKQEVIKAAAEIKNRHTALNIIKEACLLANSDNDLSEAEIVFIGDIAQAMGIELEKVERISQWVIDCLILQEQRKIIFEE